MMNLPAEPKAVRLARFLREQVQARSSVVRSLESYEDVLWFHDVPDRNPNAACNSRDTITDDEVQEGVWLEVQDEELPIPPSPDAELLPWLCKAASSQVQEESPGLNKTATIPDPDWTGQDGEEPPLKSCKLEEHPGILNLYESFAATWRTWSESLKDQIRSQKLYRKLYEIHTQLQREGENLELCVGFGLLDWPEAGKKSAHVRRHIITASAELKFLPREGIMRLECPENGLQCRLEDDMLDPEDQPDRAHYATVAPQLEVIRREDAVWDQERMFSILRTWGRALHPETSWSPNASPQRGEGTVPAVSWAPALMLRKRGQIAMLRLYDQVIASLSQSDGRVPAGWKSLLEDSDDRIMAASGGTTGLSQEAEWKDEDTEVYFPLPANKQQLEIVETIRNRRGVLVQGPPGTGKSHTIANLMCHLLASGQRVLVTAENPRALAVLRDKLPDEIKALCISVLGNGGEAFSELSMAVQQISSRRAQWNEGDNADAIKRHRANLTRLRCEKDQVERELRDIRQGETCQHHPSKGYSGTPQSIAARVNEARSRFAWMSDHKIKVEDSPLDNNQALLWLDLTRSRDASLLEQAQREIPGIDQLPLPRAMGAHFERVKALDSKIGSPPAERGKILDVLSRMEPQELEQLEIQIRGLREHWMRIDPSPWCREAAEAARLGHDGNWKALLERSQRALERIGRLQGDLGDHEVRVPEKLEPERVLADAQAVLEHLSSGGKWRNFLGRHPKPIQGREYLLEEVTVDASAPDEIHELKALILALKKRLCLSEVDRLWVTYEAHVQNADDKMRLLRMKGRAETLESLLDLGERDRELRQRIQAKTGETLTASWVVDEAVDWVELLKAARLKKELREAHSEVDGTIRHLGAIAELHNAHEAVAQARDAILEQDTAKYGRARDLIAKCWSVREREDARISLDEAISSSSPTLHDEVLSDPSADSLESRISQLEEAWAWAAAEFWLRRFSDPHRATYLDDKRRDLEEKVKQTLISLAAELAWKKFFERMTPEQNNALKSWREAVKMMGKGTGRSAKLERLRRIAREYMDRCRDAIPVWIIPRYLVAELIEPHPERFDTVIIDEASQMGVGGLFVFFIGKRIVVVGDDQQISPSDVGVQDEAVERMRQKYIPDIDHAQALGRGGSVYQNAQIRMGRAVTLREHFRCMPEIIQFSNDLCYAVHGTPLDPLRSFGGERLDPLRAVYVKGGQRTGKGSSVVNKVEADLIVSKIEECLEHPLYEGKTIGVISLLGAAQARLIEQMLLDRLDPQTIEEHKILCGDSSAFQGDERHVIFLSMVASRGETRLSTLTSQTFVQRYNVAVSRAQDQLWLFHSVDVADLKPECLRSRLIQYVRSPRRAMLDAESQRFDSPFEREVFDLISGRGYRVRTQVAVGDARSHSYRIDMVVEGLAGRLAVECDGDRWHGPERYEQDMARQRDIERVGWEFVRIPGSAFYRDREQALQPLWARLDELGIRPAHQEITSEGPADSDSSEELPALCTQEPAHSIEERVAPALPSAGQEAARTEIVMEMIDMVDEPIFLPDPRTATPDQVMGAFVDLVRRSGPLPCEAAVRRYVREVGLRRTGRVLREKLERVLRAAIRQEELEVAHELGNHPEGDIVRLKGTPPVVMRPRGNREFEEIPPSEWAEVIAQASNGAMFDWADRDELYRTVLARRDFKSLTQKRREMLDAAWGLARAQADTDQDNQEKAA